MSEPDENTGDDAFTAALRTRLHDLAGAESGFADPLPGIARRAAADPADARVDAAVTRLDPARAHRRRRYGTWAMAAAVVGVLGLGGFGVVALGRDGSGASGSAGSAALPFDAAVEGGSGNTPGGGDAAGTPAATTTAGGAAACAPGAPCVDTVGCRPAAEAVSTGPLAAVASVTPSGFTGLSVAAGGTVPLPYVLSFAASGPSVQVRAATADLLVDGELVTVGGVAGPDLAQSLTPVAGASQYGSATFAAVDCQGQPLPAGSYEAVVVVPYSDGTGSFALVSVPTAVVVS